MTQPPLFPEHPYPVALMQALPLREQPAERVLANSEACNSVELLAAIINGPRQIEIAAGLLARFGNLSGIAAASPADIAAIKGVGKKTAARLLAAMQVGLRAAHDSGDRRTINSPADAYDALRLSFTGKEQEYVFVLLLDTRNRVMRQPIEVYHGSLNTSMIRIGELFREAIRWNAASIIMSHGHPSGDPSPSSVIWRRNVKRAGRYALAS